MKVRNEESNAGRVHADGDSQLSLVLRFSLLQFSPFLSAAVIWLALTSACAGQTSDTPVPVYHPPPVPETRPTTPTEEHARGLLDPGAAYPSRPAVEQPIPLPTSLWPSDIATDQPVDAPATHRLSWVDRAVARDVCSVPSAAMNETRENVLSTLANSIVEAMDTRADPCTNFYQV